MHGATIKKYIYHKRLKSYRHQLHFTHTKETSRLWKWRRNSEEYLRYLIQIFNVTWISLNACLVLLTQNR